MKPNAAQRGYDSRWQSARLAFLQAQPWCVYCAQRGQRVRATRVDHVVPHRGNQRLFWDRSNWQGLCTTCHQGAKQGEEATGQVRGCDEHGVPLDPAHPWNRGGRANAQDRERPDFSRGITHDSADGNPDTLGG